MKHLLLVIALLSSVAFAQSTPASWNQSVEPFRIIGNIYYVGASDLTSYLITSPRGHILLDAGLAETAPMIRDNIRKLGFKLRDVKYLINSHAHYDHAAGFPQLKRWTGAQFVTTRATADLLERGGLDDPMYLNRFPFPPSRPDRIIGDGDTVTVGDAVMTAHLTPGHTQGCTTWTTDVTENGKRYHVLFLCSVSAPGYKLVNNPKYPNVVADYRHTFAYLKTLPCDVFLGAHGSFFHLTEKRAELKADPKRNPFIDPREFRAFIDRAQSDFEAELKAQEQAKN
jgi:metallo-beta-lactamase class B